jgi:hypothetical protein
MSTLFKILNAGITSFILVLFLFVTVLSFKNFKNEPLYIEKEFTGLFEAFQQDAKFYNVTPDYSGLTTTFVDDIRGDILGYCIPKFNTVKISRVKWNRFDTVKRKLLLYHEWAHCTLWRDHTEDTGFICPISIMHPYITPTASCYLSFKEWYDRELFTNPNKTKLINKENYETTHPTNATHN